MIKKINLEDRGQDLTHLIVTQTGSFLKIIDLPSSCSAPVREVYLDQWIDSKELIPGQSFLIVDPRNGFTGFECKWNFESIEDCHD